MILDGFLKMADAITVGASTAATLTTSYVDTIAEGDDNVGCFVVFHAETAIVSATAGATVTFNLLHSDTTAASSFTTLVSSGAVDDGDTVAGYQKAIRIPSGAKRYLMGSVVTSAVTSSGTVSTFVAKDVDINAQLKA